MKTLNFTNGVYISLSLFLLILYIERKYEEINSIFRLYSTYSNKKTLVFNSKMCGRRNVPVILRIKTLEMLINGNDPIQIEIKRGFFSKKSSIEYPTSGTVYQFNEPIVFHTSFRFKNKRIPNRKMYKLNILSVSGSKSQTLGRLDIDITEFYNINNDKVKSFKVTSEGRGVCALELVISFNETDKNLSDSEEKISPHERSFEHREKSKLLSAEGRGEYRKRSKTEPLSLGHIIPYLESPSKCSTNVDVSRDNTNNTNCDASSSSDLYDLSSVMEYDHSYCVNEFTRLMKTAFPITTDSFDSLIPEASYLAACLYNCQLFDPEICSTTDFDIVISTIGQRMKNVRINHDNMKSWFFIINFFFVLQHIISNSRGSSLHKSANIESVYKNILSLSSHYEDTLISLLIKDSLTIIRKLVEKPDSSEIFIRQIMDIIVEVKKNLPKDELGEFIFQYCMSEVDGKSLNILLEYPNNITLSNAVHWNAFLSVIKSDCEVEFLRFRESVSVILMAEELAFCPSLLTNYSQHLKEDYVCKLLSYLKPCNVVPNPIDLDNFLFHYRFDPSKEIVYDPASLYLTQLSQVYDWSMWDLVYLDKSKYKMFDYLSSIIRS